MSIRINKFDGDLKIGNFDGVSNDVSMSCAVEATHCIVEKKKATMCRTIATLKTMNNKHSNDSLLIMLK